MDKGAVTGLSKDTIKSSGSLFTYIANHGLSFIIPSGA
jgi:hypothetical protein